MALQEFVGTADRRGIVQSLEPVEPERRIHYRAVAPRTGNARSGNDNILVTEACYVAWEAYRRDKRNHPDEYEVRAFVAAFEAISSAPAPAKRTPTGTFRQGIAQGKQEAEAEIAAVLIEYGGDAPTAGQTVASAVRRLIATLTDPAPAPAATGPTLTVETALRGCRLSELLGEIQRRQDEAERVQGQRYAGELATKDGEIAALRDAVAALKPDAERFRQARALFGAA